jgi:hypothetical protein
LTLCGGYGILFHLGKSPVFFLVSGPDRNRRLDGKIFPDSNPES